MINRKRKPDKNRGFMTHDKSHPRFQRLRARKPPIKVQRTKKKSFQIYFANVLCYYLVEELSCYKEYIYFVIIFKIETYFI